LKCGGEQAAACKRRGVFNRSSTVRLKSGDIEAGLHHFRAFTASNSVAGGKAFPLTMTFQHTQVVNQSGFSAAFAGAFAAPLPLTLQKLTLQLLTIGAA
jgi:hypothetical protein